MKTHFGYTRLQFIAFLRRTIPDFREADMHATADDYETSKQFISDDCVVMKSARKALLAASAHLPKDSNAAALVKEALAGLADALEDEVKRETSPQKRRCLDLNPHLKD